MKAGAVVLALFLATTSLFASPISVTLGQALQQTTLTANPIMYATPFCFAAGGPTAVSIEGRNFPPGATVQVSKSDDLRLSGIAVASPYGHFTTSLNVSVNEQTPGMRFDARIVGGGDVPPPIAVVYVNGCGYNPEVTATPNCGDPNNPTIHVTGSRFTTGGTIHVELTDGTNTIGTGTDAPSGTTFDVTFQPGVTLQPGQYTIRATQSEGEFYSQGYDTFTVPCPQLTFDAVCAPPGSPPDTMAISVSGSGWASGTADGEDEIQIVFDLGGEAQEFQWMGDPHSGTGFGAGGTFGPFLIQPFKHPAAPQPYTIEVKQQGYDRSPYLDLEQAFTVPCATPTATPTGSSPSVTIPSVTLDQTCGQPAILGDTPRSYKLNLTVNGFVAGVPVDITFDADGVGGPSYPPGKLEVPYTAGPEIIPLAVSYRPPGNYRILVSQPTLEQSATFSVPCAPPLPLLTLKPTCGNDSAGPYTITVTGSGWVPGPVSLTFDPTGTPETGPPAIADDSGNLTATLVATGRPPGDYKLLASQSTVLGIYDQFPADFLITCQGQVLLKITPTNGAPGFVPLVEGSGFSANATLNLRWDHGIGSSVPVTVQTDANGNFTRQLVIFAHDFLGLRHLSVQDPNDPTLYTNLVVTYLVSSGTVTPPLTVDNPFGPPDPIVIRH